MSEVRSKDGTTIPAVVEFFTPPAVTMASRT
jgi:hypothetical protein